MVISRQRLVLSVIVCVLLAVLLLQPLRHLIPAKPLVIASHVWLGYEPLFLAQREAWLDKRLAALYETASATQSLLALKAGYVDGAALTLDETLRARAEGIPLSVVAVLDSSAGADVLLVKPAIKTLGDLKHRRVGVEQTALGALMLALVLREAGLSKTDIQAVPLTIDQQLTAWQHNKVDAVISFEPIASRLQAEGAVKLFDSRQLPDVIVDVLAIREEALRDKAQAVRHLVSVQLETLNYVHHNPQDAAFRMAQHLKLPPDILWARFKGLVLPGLENNHRLLRGSPPKLRRSAEKLASLMQNEGLLAERPALDDLIRDEFLPAWRQ